MREQYEFDPVVAELEFGFRTSAPAWEIRFGRRPQTRLARANDRIDLCRQAGGDALCVVMDYKSGGQKLDAILIEHGVQLQLLAYLAAIRSWPPEVWAGLNLPAFFSLSSFGEERAGERSPIVSKSNPLAPTLSPFGRGEEKSQKFWRIKITPAGVFYVNLRGQYEAVTRALKYWRKPATLANGLIGIRAGSMRMPCPSSTVPGLRINLITV